MPGLARRTRRRTLGKGATPPRAVGAELAIVLGPGFAREHFLDVAAAADPVAAQFGEAGVDVDADVGVGVGAGRIIDVERGLAA